MSEADEEDDAIEAMGTDTARGRRAGGRGVMFPLIESGDRLISSLSARPAPPRRLGAVGARLSSLGHRALFAGISRPCALRVLRWVAGFRRLISPVLVLGGVTAPLRHADMKEALEREADFDIAEDMAPRLPAGPMPIGMAWPAQHREHRARLEKAVGASETAPEIIALRHAAKGWIAARLAAHKGSVNVARDYSEEIVLDAAHGFFGLGDNTPKTREELRLVFRLLAAQVVQPPPAGSELARWTREAERYLLHVALASASAPVPGTVLERLLNGGAKPESAARDTASLAAFGSGTVGRATTQAVYRLLTLRGARRKAADVARNGSDADVVRMAHEALRFSPMLPLIGIRTALQPTYVGACPQSRARIAQGGKLMPSPLIAMFDPKAFPDPGAFDSCRQGADYLHYGAGRHVCLGRHAADALISEMIRALFLKDNLRLATPWGRLVHDGPAVETLRVRYDA